MEGSNSLVEIRRRVLIPVKAVRREARSPKSPRWKVMFGKGEMEGGLRERAWMVVVGPKRALRWERRREPRPPVAPVIIRDMV